MRALLIDPVARTITEVTIESWRDIAPALGCSMFDVVKGDYRHDLYVDDEGLLVYPNPLGYFGFTGRVFAGRGLILGHYAGDSCDAVTTVDIVESVIEWMDTPAAEDVEPRFEISFDEVDSTPTTTTRGRCLWCGTPSTHQRKTAAGLIVVACPEHQRELEANVVLVNGWRTESK